MWGLAAYLNVVCRVMLVGRHRLGLYKSACSPNGYRQVIGSLHYCRLAKHLSAVQFQIKSTDKEDNAMPVNTVLKTPLIQACTDSEGSDKTRVCVARRYCRGVVCAGAYHRQLAMHSRCLPCHLRLCNRKQGNHGHHDIVMFHTDTCLERCLLFWRQRAG